MFHNFVNLKSSLNLVGYMMMIVWSLWLVYSENILEMEVDFYSYYMQLMQPNVIYQRSLGHIG